MLYKKGIKLERRKTNKRDSKLEGMGREGRNDGIVARKMSELKKR